MVTDLSYAHLGEGFFGVGLHRGVLFEALYGEALRVGVIVRLGIPATRLVDAARERVFVEDEHGERHGPHDLVIVADGSRSALRKTSGLDHEAREYRWGALWWICADPEERYHGRLYQVVDGTRRFLGLLPTGLGPKARGNGAPLVSLFWSLSSQRVAAWRAAGLEAWKQEVRAVSRAADPVLEQITSADQLAFTTYMDIHMETWNTRNVVYLGDAAHATSPQLGQGCNLALIDAMVLADVLAREPHVPTALDEYSRVRRSHLRFYQMLSRLLTPMFQSDGRILGWLRDATMWLPSTIPFLRRETLRTLAGMKTGLLRGELKS
jgi:2-polyprenyl-6-methoxyphenol hydroxylase-like FAD-dependent oxidoreductase